jgi:hypothetical protein
MDVSRDEFRAFGAATDALRFAARNFGRFSLLVGAWSLAAFAITVGMALLVQPAGAGAPIGTQVDALDNVPGARLILLIPSLLATVAIGVIWTRFAILEDEPVNPLRVSGEMGLYLVKNLQLGLVAGAAAIPVAILVLVVAGLARMIGPQASVVALIAAIVILGLPALLVVYGRLTLVLPAAALDHQMSLRESFDLTKGHTIGLAGGWLFLYLPSILGILAIALLIVVVGPVLGTTESLVREVFSNLVTLAATGLIAGFLANAYRALMPGDVGDRIARQFE